MRLISWLVLGRKIGVGKTSLQIDAEECAFERGDFGVVALLTSGSDRGLELPRGWQQRRATINIVVTTRDGAPSDAKAGGGDAEGDAGGVRLTGEDRAIGIKNHRLDFPGG